MTYEEKYKSKIKSLPEVTKILGPYPRDKTVIMCHGTFDVVHPGHLRHLMYTKTKADILLVSVTCDAHVTKADFRPFVPEGLRALNLAAFEMVDYVIIDENPTPTENIGKIKPDLFAKGYEYNADGLNLKTEEEKKALEAYGGDLIFTPGDIVYSSSKLIESQRPDISNDKLMALMSAENVTFGMLHETLGKFLGVKVHVVGDTIIDTYTDTSMIGGQTKTPTISVRHEGERKFVGGAGIVAKHLRAAGAEVTFTTVLGDDALAKFALEDLEEAGVKLNIITDPTRPTTNKNAIVCNDYRLLKIDTLDNTPISEDLQVQIEQYISDTRSECIVFSDFRHGIFNKASIEIFIRSIPENTYRVADSQVASRWGNITDFKGFDLITPNEREARFSLGDQDSVIRPLALRLFQVAKCKNLILKLGDRGLMSYRRKMKEEAPGGKLNSFFVLDPFTSNVVDPVGSGDALLSYACLGDCIAEDTVIAAILGALAAACACEYDGNKPVTVDCMHSMLDKVENRILYQ